MVAAPDYLPSLVPLQRHSLTPPLILIGTKVTGSTPVPFSKIVRVLAARVPAIEMKPEDRAAFVGLYVTLMVQWACGTSNAGETGQSFVSKKGAPGGEMLVMISGEVPVFVKRMDFDALLVIAWSPKFRLVALRVTSCARRCTTKTRRTAHTLSDASRRIK